MHEIRKDRDNLELKKRSWLVVARSTSCSLGETRSRGSVFAIAWRPANTVERYYSRRRYFFNEPREKTFA